MHPPTGYYAHDPAVLILLFPEKESSPMKIARIVLDKTILTSSLFPAVRLRHLLREFLVFFFFLSINTK